VSQCLRVQTPGDTNRVGGQDTKGGEGEGGGSSKQQHLHLGVAVSAHSIHQGHTSRDNGDKARGVWGGGLQHIYSSICICFHAAVGIHPHTNDSCLFQLLNFLAAPGVGADTGGLCRPKMALSVAPAMMITSKK
jgi:hypothetical protein